MSWRATGKDLEKAEAVGNAELYVEPVQKTDKSGRKTLTAPRFDCDFLRAAISPAIAPPRWRQSGLRSFQRNDKHGPAHHDGAENGRPVCARDAGHR